MRTRNEMNERRGIKRERGEFVLRVLRDEFQVEDSKTCCPYGRERRNKIAEIEETLCCDTNLNFESQ